MPDRPSETDWLWSVFLRLHRARLSDQPLQFSEVRAFADLYRIDFAPRDLDVLFDLNRIWHRIRKEADG